MISKDQSGYFVYCNQFSAHYSQETLGALLEAVKTEDESLAHHFKKSEEWATVEEMIAAHGCKLYELCHEKLSSGFQTRSGTNWAVQP